MSTPHELLKISAYLCNSAMHSAGFFFLYSMYLYFCFVFAMHYYLHAFHNLAVLTTPVQAKGMGLVSLISLPLTFRHSELSKNFTEEENLQK